MTTKSKNEINYMNYMKFFGIVYLMIWHAAIDNINIIVISFFLQMFFFISGYFYKEIYSNKPFTFIRKRIKSLYIPYITYCLIFLVLNNSFVKFNIIPNSHYIASDKLSYNFVRILTLESMLQMGGAMWFVASLFFSSILFCCISSILTMNIPFVTSLKENESFRFLSMVTLFLIGNYLSVIKYRLPHYIDVSFVLVFFYYLGHLYRKHEEKISLNIYLALSSLLILCICSKFGYPQFAQRKYVDPSFILLCGVAGIYLNIYISKKISAYKEIEFVNYAGKNTMAILALHFLAFKLVSILFIYTQGISINLLPSFPVIESANQYYRWLYATSGILLPLAVIFLFDKIYLKINALFQTRAKQFVKKT